MNVTLLWENLLDEKGGALEFELSNRFLAKMVWVNKLKWKDILDESRIFHPWDKFCCCFQWLGFNHHIPKSQNLLVFFIPTWLGWCFLVVVPNLSLGGGELFACLVLLVSIANLVPPVSDPNLVPLVWTPCWGLHVWTPNSVPLVPTPSLVSLVPIPSSIASSIPWVPMYFSMRLPTHTLI